MGAGIVGEALEEVGVWIGPYHINREYIGIEYTYKRERKEDQEVRLWCLKKFLLLGGSKVPPWILGSRIMWVEEMPMSSCAAANI